jgi:hypothetical protein
LHEVGLKIVILEGFYTLEEIEQAMEQVDKADLD